jgi:hypothetical protein
MSWEHYPECYAVPLASEVDLSEDVTPTESMRAADTHSYSPDSKAAGLVLHAESLL